jgi:hypothetical protein
MKKKSIESDPIDYPASILSRADSVRYDIAMILHKLILDDVSGFQIILCLREQSVSERTNDKEYGSYSSGRSARL